MCRQIWRKGLVKVMTISPLQRQRQNTKACVHCSSPVDANARFCGECGAPGHHTHEQAGGSPQQLAQQLRNVSPIGPVTAANIASAPVHTDRGFQFPQANSNHFRVSEPLTGEVVAFKAPSFATVSPMIQRVTPEMREEMGKMMVLLARERIFLVLHCLNFLLINGVGFWLAMKAYSEYNADEITKSVIALTPLMFINSFALVCLSPIKGTKLEIGRLKERIKYLRIQIEYGSIV